MPLIIKGSVVDNSNSTTEPPKENIKIIEQPTVEQVNNINKSKEFHKIFGTDGHQKKSGFMDDMFSS